mgnify:FL=1
MGNALAEARASEPFAGDEAVENLALVQLAAVVRQFFTDEFQQALFAARMKV